MLKFKNIVFSPENSAITLEKLGFFCDLNSGFVQVQIAGENKDTHMGAKMMRSSEAGKLSYKNHTISENTMTVVQESPNVRCKIVFETYDDTNAIRVHTVVTNMTNAPIVLEEVSAFCLTGIGDKNEPDNMYFTDFLQSHHAECQPRRFSFEEAGFFRANNESQKRIAFANVGSWSTKEELPQGILEDEKNRSVLMF